MLKWLRRVAVVVAAGWCVAAEVAAAEVVDARVLRWLPTQGLVGGSSFDGSLQALGDQSVEGRIGKGFCIGKGEGYALRDRNGQPVGNWERDQVFTVSLWVKLEGTTGPQQTMVAKLDPSQRHRGWCFDVYPDSGKVGMELLHAWPDNAIKVLAPAGTLQRGRWHQIVMMYDGSGKAAGITLHVDGVTRDMLVDKDSLTKTIRNTVDTLVGSRAKGNYKGHGLVVDDLRIFNRLLDTNEIARLAKLVPGRPVGRGATVRVSLAGKATLSLAEVEVFVDGFNVAPTGQASQSATHQPAEAGRGNDGNTNGRYDSGSVTHTPVNGPDPWWQVDLAFPAPIEHVVVWNRTDGGGLEQRLDNAKVEVLDVSGRVLWSGQVGSPAPRKTVFEVGLVDLEALRPSR